MDSEFVRCAGAALPVGTLLKGGQMRRFVLLSALAAALSVPAMAGQGGQIDPALQPFIAINAGTVAIQHVRVIDGTGSASVADQSVVFSKGVITQVGASARVHVPIGARVIDAHGETLLPGYVGTHNHLFTGVGPSAQLMWRSMPYSFPRLYLAAGTTTIRTTGSLDIFVDLHLKRDIDAGLIPGPHIDVTSPYLTGPGNPIPQLDELRSAADARQTVDFWADHGVTSYKVYTDISRDALAAVIKQAHKRHLKVMGHLCSVGYHEAAFMGIDELEHGPFFTDTDAVGTKKPDVCPSTIAQDQANVRLAIDGPQVKALIADLKQHHVVISSTLPVFESFLPGLPPDHIQEMSLALMDPEQRLIVSSIRRDIDNGTRFARILKTDPTFVSDLRTLMKKEMAFELAFAQAGGVVSCGPDPSGYGAVIAGLGDWREIELLVQGGFSPVQAIRVATLNGAIALGRESSIGSIAVGKRADLILVEGDPSRDITAIEQVKTVFKDGVGYNSHALLESARGFVGHV